MHLKITPNCNKISLSKFGVTTHQLSQNSSTEGSPGASGSDSTQSWWHRLSTDKWATWATDSGLWQSFFSQHKCYIPQSQEGKLWSELEVHLSQISSDHSPHLTPEDRDEDLVSAVMFNALFSHGGCMKRHIWTRSECLIRKRTRLATSVGS